VTSQRVPFLIFLAQKLVPRKKSSWISPEPSVRVAINLELRPRTIPERLMVPISTTFSPGWQLPMVETLVWSR
jgi:hypothetical protein